MPETGVKIADVAVELATRRWSDLETLILVAFDRRDAPTRGGQCTFRTLRRRWTSSRFAP